MQKEQSETKSKKRPFKRQRLLSRNILELSFLPILLTWFSHRLYALLLVNRNCLELYKKICISQATWNSTQSIQEDWLQHIRYWEVIRSYHCHSLPPNVTDVNWNCNKLLPLQWPSSLTLLDITYPLRQYDLSSLSSLLSLSVVIDTRCRGFVVPPNVTHFALSSNSNALFVLPQLVLPPQLMHLRWNIDAFLPHLPSHIHFVHFGRHYHFDMTKWFQQENKPQIITTYHWLSSYPNKIQHLCVTGPISQAILLPSTLVTLRLEYHFNSPIALPPHLVELWLPNNFNQPIAFFPFTLQRIRFGARFNQSIDALPDGLLKLELGMQFRHSLALLPDSIVDLQLRCIHYHTPILRLPLQLKYLKVKDCTLKQIYSLPNGLQKLDMRLCNKLFDLRVKPSTLHRLLLIVTDCKRYKTIPKHCQLRCIMCWHEEHSCKELGRCCLPNGHDLIL